MLMQNFKTAADLGITEAQKSALAKTLVLAETGRLHYTDPCEFESPKRSQRVEFTGHFNMSWWSLPKSCGTCCCLGGTAELVGGLDENELDDAADTNIELKNLFYPGLNRDQDRGFRMKFITPAQAATALRSYLTTGDAKWHEAIA